jgi:hypothetical protein
MATSPDPSVTVLLLCWRDAGFVRLLARALAAFSCTPAALRGEVYLAVLQKRRG